MRVGKRKKKKKKRKKGKELEQEKEQYTEQNRARSVAQEEQEGGRKKEKPARGVVTERDAQACRFVCEQGAMTVEQLWRAVWWSNASRSPRYAYQRVLFLERSGFLEPIRSPFSLKTYFKGTRAAQELAGSSAQGSGLIPLSAPSITEIPHVDGLTELRLSTHRAGRSVDWRTDRVLVIDPSFPKERFYGHIPDAIWVTASGRRVAVEYERTRKGTARVRQKVEAFTRELARPDRVFDLVLWIATAATLSELQTVLAVHPEQQLRTMDQFLSELKTSSQTASGPRGEE